MKLGTHLLFTLAFCLPDTPMDSNTFTFKSVTQADLPLLFDWFKQPYIEELWKEPKEYATFEAKYLDQIATKSIIPFMAYIQDNPVAFIQYHHTDELDRGLAPEANIPVASVGFDLFIGNPDYLNKGYGTKLLQEFMVFVKGLEPNCQAIIIDPATDNDRAIACYKKVGFKTIGEYIAPYGPTGEGPGPILLMIYYFKD